MTYTVLLSWMIEHFSDEKKDAESVVGHIQERKLDIFGLCGMEHFRVCELPSMGPRA